MRLPMPNIKQLHSEEGAWSLSYEGIDSSHDLGGGIYLFTVKVSGSDIEIRAQVRWTTSKVEQVAVTEGVDYQSLPLPQKRKYREKVSELLGIRYEITIFDVINGRNDQSIIDLAEIFCRAFFDLHSSFRHNNSEFPSSGEGYFPDEIYFCPYGLDKKSYATFHAGEGRDD